MSTKSALSEVRWVRSSACVGESHCVEVGRIDDSVAMRDSKAPEVVLIFAEDTWLDFVDAIKAGEILR